MKKAFVPVLFSFFLLADQLSKLAVQKTLRLYEAVEVIPSLFNIVYVRNPGSAFGLFAELSPMFRQIFFAVITLIACFFLLTLIKKEYSYKLRVIAYTAIIAGAVGNLIDRLRFNYVVDFLDFYYKSYHWYTFNIADVCITCGVALLMIDWVFGKKQNIKKA